MKVNPAAIQSYQQVTHRAMQRPAEEKKQAELLERDLSIAPQPSTGSDLAVRGPEGSYAEFLTEAEKTALDLLFERFGDGSRFGAAFGKSNGESAPAKTLGKLVDIKV